MSGRAPRRFSFRAALIVALLLAWFGGFVWFLGAIPDEVSDPENEDR